MVTDGPGVRHIVSYDPPMDNIILKMFEGHEEATNYANDIVEWYKDATSHHPDVIRSLAVYSIDTKSCCCISVVTLDNGVPVHRECYDCEF